DVEPEAGEVDRPDDVRQVGEHERARRRPVRRADDRRLQPLGCVLGNALLEERAALGAVREALHQRRPAAGGAHERLRDGQVVPDELELRLAALGEEHLVGARDRELPAGDLEHVLLSHGSTVSTEDAGDDGGLPGAAPSSPPTSYAVAPAACGIDPLRRPRGPRAAPAAARVRPRKLSGLLPMGITERLARSSSRHPWRTFAAWIAAIVVGVGLAVVFLPGNLTTEGHVTGKTESKQAAELFRQRFPPDKNAVDELIVVRSPTRTVDDPSFRSFVAGLLREGEA